MWPGITDRAARNLVEVACERGILAKMGNAKRGAFTAVYASSFYFNEKGVAGWPAQVVNYTNKTQFLFRIEK